METSLYLSKAFGLFFTVIALAMIINRERFITAMDDIAKHTGLMFLSAVLTLMIGALLIAIHNIWVGVPQIIITLICWAIFVKGVLRLIFSRWHETWAAMLRSSKFYYLSAFIILAFGIYWLYVGFFVN